MHFDIFSACHPPFLDSKGGCYVIKVSLPWSEARADCQQLGGDLVIINSAAEQKILEELIKEHYDKDKQYKGKSLYFKDTM